MKISKRLPLLAALLGALAVIAMAQGPKRERRGYGIEVTTDQALYAGGSQAEVRYRLRNDTPLDVFCCCVPGLGGFCAARLAVLDLQGNIVWEPRRVFCTPQDLLLPLPSGSSFTDTLSFPLVYDNLSGFGDFGQPLAAGPYVVRLTFRAEAPNPEPGVPLTGGRFSAEVPIRVEPLVEDSSGRRTSPR